MEPKASRRSSSRRWPFWTLAAPVGDIDTGSEEDRTGMNWQADLAVTLRKLVESEKEAKGTREQRLQAVSDRFYRGDVAEALEAWYIERAVSRRWLAYKTPVVDPLEARIVDTRSIRWSRAGPYLLQTLRLLEGFDLKKRASIRRITSTR
jgi:gamma-glutamyltranspeptidase/glutathione hydrolase